MQPDRSHTQRSWRAPALALVVLAGWLAVCVAFGPQGRAASTTPAAAASGPVVQAQQEPEPPPNPDPEPEVGG